MTLVLPPPQPEIASAARCRHTGARKSVRGRIRRPGLIERVKPRLVTSDMTAASAQITPGAPSTGGNRLRPRPAAPERAVVVTVTVIGPDATPKPTGTEAGLTMQVLAFGAPLQASDTDPIKVPAAPALSM